jgi:NAD(P)H-nitrite reductase large subunit
MRASHYISVVGLGVLGIVFVCSFQARADSLLDFTVFNPPAAAKRQIQEPIVSWLIKPNAQTYCEQAQPKDGFYSRQEGCVYWARKSSTCTIITTNNTTHSQLGHLFVHCMLGQ